MMADIPPTRASLLVRLRNPEDASAWTQFIELYGPLVYGYVRRQGLQDADAADVAQDVFQAVISAVGRLEYDPNRGAFRNWLFTIVRRCLSAWRSKNSGGARGSGGSETRDLLEQIAVSDNDDAEWERAWRHRLFTWACEKVQPSVSASTWQAFWRTAVGGEPGNRVAAELGISVAAVYLARGRVLARLQDSIRLAQQE
jgi:RNA polymerase sigma-70 factor (ECF subfamily)